MIQVTEILILFGNGMIERGRIWPPYPWSYFRLMSHEHLNKCLKLNLILFLLFSFYLRSIPYSAVYDLKPLMDYQDEHATWARAFLTEKLFGNPKIFESLNLFEFDR